MTYARKIGDNWVEINGPFVFDEIQYPQNWPELITQDEREAMGIYEIAPAPELPENSKFGGIRIDDYNGLPRYENIIVGYTPSEAADIMWERAKAHRQSIYDAGAPTPFGRFHCDTVGKLNLSGSVQTAQIMAGMGNTDFTLEHTLVDNTTRTFTIAEITQAGLTVSAYISDVHIHSQAIRKLLYKAVDDGKSAEYIFQIDITAGYPPA